jgi:hypothetical protein
MLSRPSVPGILVFCIIQRPSELGIERAIRSRGGGVDRSDYTAVSTDIAEMRTEELWSRPSGLGLHATSAPGRMSREYISLDSFRTVSVGTNDVQSSPEGP